MTDGSTPPENPLVAALKNDFGSRLTNVTSPRSRRVIVDATLDSYRDAIKYLQEKMDCYHLSLINGVDLKTTFEVVYHFWSDKNGMFTLKVPLSHDNPEIGTVTDIVPAAMLYEREVHDLFGIEFPGHPDMRRLILSDDWPPNEHPLRKDWKPGEKKMLCLVKSAALKASKWGEKSA